MWGMQEKEQNAGNTAENQQKRIIGRPFPPGVSGNPSGRPKGSKNFTTLFEEAVKKLALGETPDDVEMEILRTGIEKAKAGSFSFYKDIFDRIYGQPTKTIDLTGSLKVQKIQELEEKLRNVLENE
jgi:hypothetical protein